MSFKFLKKVAHYTWLGPENKILVVSPFPMEWRGSYFLRNTLYLILIKSCASLEEISYPAFCRNLENNKLQGTLPESLNKVSLEISVEVGRVCGLNCHKPKSSSIRNPNSPRNIIPSIADL